MATNKLPETKVRSAKPKDKAYRLSDGGGLYLLVNKDGSKWWRLDYTFRQKRKTISVGVYPKVTLYQAREKARKAKHNISDGIDPSELRKAEKKKISIEIVQEQRLAEGLPIIGSFEEVAGEWGKENVNNWEEKNERTKRLLERNIFPSLGRKPIDDITSAELRDVLFVMRDAGILESAHRTFRICGRIFRYAILNGKCNQDITLPIAGVLKPAKAQHFASITEPKEVSLLLKAIDGYEGSFIVKSALPVSIIGICSPWRAESRRMGSYRFG